MVAGSIGRAVCVATFNIRHGAGRDGAVDLGRTAAVIRETGADLVALQEVDRWMKRSGEVDQADRLSWLTGMTVHFFPTIRPAAREYGIALASADDLVPRYVALPRLGREEPRGAIVTRWNGLSVVATHLSTDARARRAQTEALADLARGLESPAIVMGDLNQTYRGLGPLVAAGFRGSPERVATFRSRFRSKQIDHVLAGPGLEPPRAWTLASDASDHAPLVAEIAL